MIVDVLADGGKVGNFGLVMAVLPRWVLIRFKSPGTTWLTLLTMLGVPECVPKLLATFGLKTVFTRVMVCATMLRNPTLLKSEFCTVAVPFAVKLALATLNDWPALSSRMPSPEFTVRYCACAVVPLKLTEPDLEMTENEPLPVFSTELLSVIVWSAVSTPKSFTESVEVSRPMVPFAELNCMVLADALE